jgi:hypothetical protein
MTINVVFSLDPKLLALVQTFETDFAQRLTALEKHMAALDDAIAAVKVSADAAVARVTTDVAALKAQIAALQAQVDAGGTPAQIQALADLKAEFDALDPTNPAVLPAAGPGIPVSPAAAAKKH